MKRYVSYWKHLISGWFYYELYPSTAKWDSSIVLSLRIGDNNGQYHIQEWAR